VTSASLARYIRKVFVNALDIHANTIVSVALGAADYRSSAWSSARLTAQQSLRDIFVIDGNMVRSLYTHLGSQANEARRRKSKHAQDTFPTARIATALWAKTYELTSSTQLDGIPPLMQGLRRFAHLPVPGGRAWSHENLEFWKEEQKWAQSVTTLRSTMKAMKDAFGTKVTSAISISDPGRLQQLWATSEFPQLVMHLTLCSDEDIHNAVIGLIQTTYEDVDSRVDCIRQMLTTYPVDTVKALIEFLDNWNNDVRDMPTAVETARWVVRCFTDIIDVLCRQTNTSTGFVFLSDEIFLGTAIGTKKMSDYLLQLWNSMTCSLANIFKMTSRWAPFYDNKEMVDWMQDALIFGRLLVEETQNFETAVMGSAQAGIGSSQSRTLEKKTASKLVDNLEPVLENLLGWLRLTE
jgi:senataxin